MKFGNQTAKPAEETKELVATGAPTPAITSDSDDDFAAGVGPQQGRGVSTNPDDSLLPMVKWLQGKSPEVERQGPSYVPGAEPGMIIIKNTSIEPIPLFTFQPCKWSRAVVEWLPRTQGGGGGGGFVRAHTLERPDPHIPGAVLQEPEDAINAPKPGDATKTIRVSSKTGNWYVDTRYMAGYILLPGILPIAAVLPFSSTGQTVAKRWNSEAMRREYPPGKGSIADLWLFYYDIGMKYVAKGGNSWFIPTFAEANTGIDQKTGLSLHGRCPTVADAKRGERLFTMLSAGEVKIDAAAQADEDDGVVENSETSRM